MKHDLDNFASDNKRKNTKNKGRTQKQKTSKSIYVIPAISVVVLAAVMLYLIFGTSAPIEKTWLHKSESGNEYYYTFYEESDKLEITIGTDHFMCTYNTDGDKLTTTYDNNSIYPDNLFGEYTFEVTEENGNNVLTLTDFDGAKITLSEEKVPADSDFLKPYENYKVDEKIVGTWQLTYDLGKMQLVINDDGTLVLNLLDIEYQHYVYTASENVIKMSFFKDQKVEFTEQYKLVDGKLEFLGIPWERVK